ncbi:MAG: ATP-dependent Clp protease ATP-binding subunit [Clostridia bacterium]|nr:ATP-dependent Clp protease ATP-binding subunit [Clostridia bacterium]MBQ4349654.1 ATP-dependent Clp protease ATP-binding subunit [Clostridia bacterium]
MIMCSRCHKRVAVIFLRTIKDGAETQDGFCIKCARELGIKTIDDMIAQTGLDDETIERLNGDMLSMMENGDFPNNPENADGRAPLFNFSKLMGEGQKSERKKNKSDKKDEPEEPEYRYLSTYTTNLTERARAGKLDRIVGRDREMERVIQILSRRQKNNPCLIGEPGVGKTAIAEALAQRIADGQVPYKLKNVDVCLVDLTALVAGTQFRGQFESRVQGLLKDVTERGNVILVIDEVHNIVGVGDAEGSMNAANILKPALSRGEIQIIGATTLTEYRKYIEKDTALERRFQPVMVNEPSVADTVEILRGIKKYYEDYHGVKIADALLETAASLSERYITDRYLPDKAIDLIDEAAAHIAVNSPELAERHELADRRAEVEREQADLENEINAGDAAKDDPAVVEERYKRLADLKAEELRVDKRLRYLDELCGNIRMKEGDLADVIEIWTGVPASTIAESEYEKLERLDERLRARIVGQDEAVDAVARAVRRGRVGVSYKRKPVSFIFAGPTGVGKTELVKVLAADLFSSPETLIRLDMSEFMDKFSVSRLVGSPPGYVGYDDAGQLTEKIRRRPYSVILFDEIEKAHPDVMNILLQILDDGIITDSHGKQVDFTNTIIVMTTNAGSTYAQNKPGFTSNPKGLTEDKTKRALEDFLRPEFLNRVDEIITFNALTEENFRGIAALMLGDLKALLEKKGIAAEFTDAARDTVAEKSYSAKYGARNMRRYIQVEIEDRIAEKMIASRGELTSIRIDARDGKIVVE